MSQYIDMFGHPIDVGFIVTYTTLRCKSAHQGFAVVENIIPLVEKPGTPWHSTGPGSHIPWVREDKIKARYATEFVVGTDDRGRPRLETAYVAQTRELWHLGAGEFRRTDSRLGTKLWNDLIVIDTLVDGVRGDEDA